MRYGLIGERLGHSFSAEIHARLKSAPYELCELAPDALAAFLAERDFCGVNVTIPYKQAVIPYLDEIDPIARSVGAVNTVVARNGRLIGYNTDLFGLQTLLESLGVPIAGKTVAILGTGGTSLTARAVAARMGAGEILRVSRSEGADAVTYETFYREYASRVQILINTTPVGMYPKTDASPAMLDRLPSLEAVADVIYNPLRTQLVLDARKRGLPASGGLLMLTAQAVRASELFADVTYPDGTAERLCAELAAEKENIVLSGMPGSGKSTVGRLLATELGRCFTDMDEAITARTGRTPAEILQTDGEAVFRDIETETLAAVLHGLNHAVVALGGGTILRDRNIDLIRQNGRVCFLDRPIADLLPTADRPLSATRAELERRYTERIDRYLATADLVLRELPTPEAAVTRIRKELHI